MELTESSPNAKNTLWEKEKLLNFSFSHSVFNRLLLQTRKNQGLFRKGLKISISYLHQVTTLSYKILRNTHLIERSLASFSTSTMNSPAEGRVSHPVTTTGVPGLASLILFPCSFNISRTLEIQTEELLLIHYCMYALTTILKSFH